MDMLSVMHKDTSTQNTPQEIADNSINICVTDSGKLNNLSEIPLYIMVTFFKVDICKTTKHL